MREVRVPSKDGHESTREVRVPSEDGHESTREARVPGEDAYFAAAYVRPRKYQHPRPKEKLAALATSAQRSERRR
jgi:hypothetical protein